jgi:hypothetical protein
VFACVCAMSAGEGLPSAVKAFLRRGISEAGSGMKALLLDAVTVRCSARTRVFALRVFLFRTRLAHACGCLRWASSAPCIRRQRYCSVRCGAHTSADWFLICVLPQMATPLLHFCLECWLSNCADAPLALFPQVFLVERLDAPAGEAMLHIKVRAPVLLRCALNDTRRRTPCAMPCLRLQPRDAACAAGGVLPAANWREYRAAAAASAKAEVWRVPRLYVSLRTAPHSPSRRGV